MTTAARPTFDPARGGTGKGENDLSALSKQYSSRDLPSHTKLKYRQSGQSTADDLRGKNYRQELEERERAARDKGGVKEKRSFTETPPLLPPTSGAIETSESKRPRLDPSPPLPPPPTSLDPDDAIDDDDDDDDSDEDDTAELLRELQKIKKERAEEQARKEHERKEEEERIRTENLLKGNPLLNQQQSGSFQIKRRWDDDVIFKNCAKSEFDKKEQHFINDTIRSEFHRKFMDKYVK